MLMILPGEGSEEEAETAKTLINASVLGLIFEKINGHKDGSVFTPGSVTMYMSREAIQATVVRRFNEEMGWNCSDYEALKDKDIEDYQRANAIVDSIRICDPAVGSGHFLVSVLNEMVHTKYDLGILWTAMDVALKSRIGISKSSTTNCLCLILMESRLSMFPVMLKVNAYKRRYLMKNAESSKTVCLELI